MPRFSFRRALYHEVSAQNIRCLSLLYWPPTTVPSHLFCDIHPNCRCHGEDHCTDSALRCRDDDSCRIHCDGDHSCSGSALLDGSSASNVMIECIGSESCSGALIRCGSGHCVLSCSSTTSCDALTVDLSLSMR